MEKKLTFEDVIKLKWGTQLLSRSENPAVSVHDSPDDGKILDCEKEDEWDDIGVVLEFPIIWGDDRPIVDRMQHSEAEKLFRMLAYSAQMFKILEAIEERLITTDLYLAAQELKKKIIEGPEPSLYM